MYGKRLSIYEIARRIFFLKGVENSTGRIFRPVELQLVEESDQLDCTGNKQSGTHIMKYSMAKED